MGIRQAAIYALMYWATARFEEVRELELQQIHKKGPSLKIIKNSRTNVIKPGSFKDVSYIQILWNTKGKCAR